MTPELPVEESLPTQADCAVETQADSVDFVARALSMNVPYVPLYDQVLIKPIPPEALYKGKIIIPDTSKERSQAGVVLAVGPGVMTPAGFISVDVWRGDVVLYGKYAGFEVGVERLAELAGGDISSDVEELVTMRAQEVRLVRTPRPPKEA